jgi:signal transduction histidine kinase
VAEARTVGRRIVNAALPALVVAYAIAAIVAVPRQSSPVTTYAGASAAAYAVDLAAGLALLAAGLAAWLAGQSRRIGALAILAGVAWFGADWDGWDGGPSIVRAAGFVAMPFLLALLFHLVMAFPSGRLPGNASRVAVGTSYGLALAVSLGSALFRDPLLDLYCWRNCYDNAFLVHADPALARDLDTVRLWAALAVGVVLAGSAVWRLRGARSPGRRALWPVLVPAGLLGVAEAAYAAALLHNRFEDPTNSEFALLFFAVALAIALLATGVGWGVVRLVRARAAVTRLAVDLGNVAPTGELRDRLAVALRDPGLQVVYWLPGLRRYVDGQGQTVQPPAAAAGRAVTPILRSGREVAIVVHDAGLVDGSQLVREIGESARLAVDNERLHAEALAQLEELRASQARIVAAGDAERRRLERDLHDGAQQRLLALSYDLRLARAAAEEHDDPRLAALLAAAGEEAGSALDELRDLAHGIFPSVLGDSGLGPALATLADTAPLPVELATVTGERYAASVETTAYVSVAEAIENAVSRGATFAVVRAQPERGWLVVEVEDDGRDGTAQRGRLDDRVGAVGGTIERRGGALHLEIPCV